MAKTEYPDDYKHFDNLIWQVPTWCTAIFTGILVALNEIIKDSSTWGWVIDKNVFVALFLSSGLVFLLSLSFALYRYRYHQSFTMDKTKKPFAKVGAQSALQFSVSLQCAILLILVSFPFIGGNSFTLGIGLLLILTIYYETDISLANKKD